MHSKDSTTRYSALEVLEQVDFTKNDLDALHQAWISAFPVDTNSYTSINNDIGSIIGNIKDPRTVNFIESNYDRLRIPGIQMNMLEVLARLKTSAAYVLLKKLILEQPIPNSSVYTLTNALQDSLLLSVKLFPEVLKLYNESIIGSSLVRLSLYLIDSNLIGLENVKQYADLIYELSRRQLKELNAGPDVYPVYNNSVIEMLGKLNTKQSIGLLNNFLMNRDTLARFNAALALLGIDQPVSPLVLHKLAADNEYRIDLFSSLQKINKASLFPKEFYTQQKFAESHLYYYAYEDAEIISIQYLGEKIAKYNNKQKRYFLYKLNVKEEDKRVAYLAVCGAFDLNRNNIDVSEYDLQVNVFYDETYNPSSIEKLFREFLKSQTVVTEGSPLTK